MTEQDENDHQPNNSNEKLQEQVQQLLSRMHVLEEEVDNLKQMKELGYDKRSMLHTTTATTSNDSARSDKVNANDSSVTFFGNVSARKKRADQIAIRSLQIDDRKDVIDEEDLDLVSIEDRLQEQELTNRNSLTYQNTNSSVGIGSIIKKTNKKRSSTKRAVMINTSSIDRGIDKDIDRSSLLSQGGWSVATETEMSVQPSIGIGNTETIHMYAIATFADAIQSSIFDNNKSWKYAKAWIFGLLSLLVIGIQLLVLSFVIYDSANPTCSSHTACPAGFFCASHVIEQNVPLRQPRCFKCDIKPTSDSDCTSLERIDPFWEMKEIDQTMLWFDRDGIAHYDKNEATAFGMESEKYLECLSKKHCEESTFFMEHDTQTFDGYATYITLLVSELAPDQVIILLFVAILFGSIISEDLTEAAIEDAILDAINSNIFSNSITLKMIRVSLRTRQLVLPWFLGAATISVLLTDSLSAKNVLLNFLAVCFLAEFDNMLSKILFSRQHQAFVEHALFRDYNRYDGISVPSLWPRMFGLAISITVIAVTCFMKEISDLFEIESVSVASLYVVLVGFNASALFWSVEAAYVCKIWQVEWVPTLKFLLEMSRLFAASIIGVLCLLFPYQMMFRSGKYGLPIYCGLILLTLFSSFWIMLDRSYRRHRGQQRCLNTILLTCFVILVVMFTLWMDLFYNLGILKAIKLVDSIRLLQKYFKTDY